MRPLLVIEQTLRSSALIVAAVALALVAVALAFPTLASAGDGGFERIEDAIEAGALDPAVLAERGENGRLEGFVIFSEKAAEGAGFADEKAVLFNRLEGEVDVVRDYDPLPVALARFADPNAVLAALNEPSITGVGANRENVRFLNESLPLVRQPQAQALGYTGAGTTIAIIDGGIDYTDPAFGSCGMAGDPGCKVAASIGLAPDDCFAEGVPTQQQIQKEGGCRQPHDEADPDPHGTNVAAIALGVAPDARVVALDVFAGGSASDARILEAIKWVRTNASRFKIRAMNLSLGLRNSWNTAACSAANPYVAAFGQALGADVLPVVSSGNFAFSSGAYTDGVARPACTPGAVSVGAVYDANLGPQSWPLPPPDVGCTDATTAADRIVCFSQSGNPLTLLAPGSSIAAGGIAMSGTSQAAPHVAGAAAVLAGAAPQATPNEITNALRLGPPILDPRNLLPKPRLDLEVSLSLFRCDGEVVTIRGTNGSETIVGTPGVDVIAALGGDDVISTLGGDDRVCAGDGSDSVDGGAGSDRLLGEAGHDTLKDGDPSCTPGTGMFCAVPNLYADALVGGSGGDRADYSGRTVPVELSLDGAANDGEPGEGDSVGNDVEGAVGGSGDDRIVGDGLPNTLRGGAGTDDLDGRGGADTLDCGPDWDWFNPDPQDLSVVDCENPYRQMLGGT